MKKSLTKEAGDLLQDLATADDLLAMCKRINRRNVEVRNRLKDIGPDGKTMRDTAASGDVAAVAKLNDEHNSLLAEQRVLSELEDKLRKAHRRRSAKEAARAAPEWYADLSKLIEREAEANKALREARAKVDAAASAILKRRMDARPVRIDLPVADGALLEQFRTTRGIEWSETAWRTGWTQPHIFQRVAEAIGVEVPQGPM